MTTSATNNIDSKYTSMPGQRNACLEREAVRRGSRILLVDDHPIVRAGVKHILEASGRSLQVEEAGSEQDALIRLRGARWEALLLGLSSAGGLDVCLVKQVKREWPQLPVLVMSGQPEEEDGLRALKAGACGCVAKGCDVATVVQAVTRVLSGGRYISAQLGEKLAEQVCGHGIAPPHETLSEREYQVFTLIAAGKRCAEIAETLCLSPKTVQTYRARILEKLHVRGTAELTRYAYTHQLLE
jgi:two-component system invasion response regulator UvrY